MASPSSTRSVRQHLASSLALARRAAATCSRSMPVCRNIEPIPRCSGTNMCFFSLAPICYAFQIAQGRLHAATFYDLSVTNLPPSVPPCRLARCPALLVCNPKRTDRPRRDPRNSEGQAPGSLSARCDANTRSNRSSAPICPWALEAPCVQPNSRRPIEGPGTRNFPARQDSSESHSWLFASFFQPSLWDYWRHWTRSTASCRRQRALLLHQWIAMPSLDRVLTAGPAYVRPSPAQLAPLLRPTL
ncbi:hypothetical protein V8C26DRAFT_97674 [Trichoderma gracile]